MHAYKHPDTGRWYVRFTHRGRREHYSLKLTRRDRAEDSVNDIHELLEAGQWTKLRRRAEAEHRTVAEVIDLFLERGDQWGSRTRRSCAPTVRRIRRELGELPAADLDADAIEEYLRRLEDEGLAKATKCRHLAVFKAACKWADARGYLRHNPAASVKTPNPGLKKPRPYWDAEMTKLLPELHPPQRAITELYLRTGLRLGELEDLRWKDIDFERRELTVRHPKNEDDRTVPLSDRAFEILRARRREWERERRQQRVVDMRAYGGRANIRRIDVTVCPTCGGPMKIVAAVTELHSIRTYLEGGGLPSRPPSMARLRRASRERRPRRSCASNSWLLLRPGVGRYRESRHRSTTARLGASSSRALPRAQTRGSPRIPVHQPCPEG